MKRSSALSLEELVRARSMTRAAFLKSAAAAGAGLWIDALAPRLGAARERRSLAFSPLARGLSPSHRVPRGYRLQVLLRWGDKLTRGAPDFVPGRQTPASQSRQFGYNNDFIAFLPLPKGSRSSDHGLLCVNHEYTSAEHLFPGLTAEGQAAGISRAQADVELAALGHSVAEVRRGTGGSWRVVLESRYNRRVDAVTPIPLSGPAAGDERLRTRSDPSGRLVLGTFANCAGGTTPWGTVLSAEENFNYAFSGDPDRTPEAANHRRLGLGRCLQGWHRFHDRFDVEKEPREPNRFGWIVEIDPYAPGLPPVKRTALGRFKHEGAATALAPDGRVAVYMGDDERFEYLYRFLTRLPFRPDRPEANRELLDEGVLSAARFDKDGTVRWLPLVHGKGPLTEANGFRSQADVLIEARRAADLLGATPMDRPEDVEPHPVTGRVYVALTNNARRTPEQVDAANPRPENRHGHILELRPPGRGGKPDHSADSFEWEIFLLGGDELSCPDNLAFDPAGRLWVATDGQGDLQPPLSDSLYGIELDGPRRGAPRLFFNAPPGAEVCGPAFTPDGRTLFLAVQHPGEEKGATFDRPSVRWPDFSEDMPPRPSVVAISKEDGGEIGS